MKFIAIYLAHEIKFLPIKERKNAKNSHCRKINMIKLKNKRNELQKIFFIELQKNFIALSLADKIRYEIMKKSRYD